MLHRLANTTNRYASSLFGKEEKVGAANDFEAVQIRLALHESQAAQRSYREEAERLILWRKGKKLAHVTLQPVAWDALVQYPAERRELRHAIRPVGQTSSTIG